MIRYTEFLLLLRGKNLRIKDIIYGLIGRVWVGFGPKIYGIFGFGLFRVWVEKLYSESKILGWVQIESIFDRSTSPSCLLFSAWVQCHVVKKFKILLRIIH